MGRASTRKDPTGLQERRIDDLNSGIAEASTLKECLVVDFAALMKVVLPEIGKDAIAAMEKEGREGILKRMRLAGGLILDRLGTAVLPKLTGHPSDTVRGWACFVIGAREKAEPAGLLDAIHPLADDHHFGVREWAWMAVRPHMVADLETYIVHLASWAGSPSERVRRFSSESIRPRGVWASHIDLLKKHPEMGLPVLDRLRADPANYVQLSVGNWLNDAGKDQPEWVRTVCRRWLTEEEGSPHTKRIVDRALRSLK
ncbi:DNA alkylation repair protein [Brachymonas sp. M4Q-1]|uniref:DNA alkylation repair protein n=1 Tax=Brachymonas sp. M4Q-1 TaxID=3416906 RepID=UPI003CFB463E